MMVEFRCHTFPQLPLPTHILNIMLLARFAEPITDQSSHVDQICTIWPVLDAIFITGARPRDHTFTYRCLVEFQMFLFGTLVGHCIPKLAGGQVVLMICSHTFERFCAALPIDDIHDLYITPRENFNPVSELVRWGYQHREVCNCVLKICETRRAKIPTSGCHFRRTG